MPFAAIGPLRIHYEVHGPPPCAASARPVLFVGGLASDAHIWEKQVAAFAGERPVVVLDNRGSGRSSKPPGPYSTAEMAEDVRAVLDAAGFGRVHVVGISLGGLMVQEFALRDADRVRSLALLATFAHADLTLEPPPGARGADFPALLQALDRGQGAGDLLMVFSALGRLGFSPEFLRRERAYLQALFARSLQYGLSFEALVAQFQASLAHDTRDRLPNLNTPTLVVLGTADALVPPELSRRLAAAIRGARIEEIRDAPHNLGLERADDVNKLLALWFLENDQGE